MRDLQHVSLRGYAEGDVDVISSLLNNYAVTKYLSSRIPFPYSRDDAVWWVNTGSKAELTRVIDVDGRLTGIVGAARGQHENRRSAEIGYWLGQPFWGRGIATRAVALMTEYVFNETDIVRLFAPVYAPNKASMRVVEKCGYQLEGIARKSAFKNGEFYDEFIYARLKP
ncbi:GNAT family N-acetyltransferase [Methylophaga sp. OBS4]|uniref:GNAT family N-acetyltransferase n=1 Tax=Methylophaga sp. OBS4 TaxID=2991935 RepID=UPI0022560199|nr:GNAT family protein [Methylophaga sp. OBS4]MCX4186984.1 GNAT family N-acetyltransferase [Methylophaga sp. OBS4]